LNIIVGSTVLWINNDSSSHTVSSSDNIFSSGFLSSGQKYQFTFLSSGRYSYKCDLHSNMKGIIKVISTKND
jgi:plastocyanin